MRLPHKLFALLPVFSLLSGCVITPYGIATLTWRTVYFQETSTVAIKQFRDGEVLDGAPVTCNNLTEKNASCSCSVSRAWPVSDKVKWGSLPTEKPPTYAGNTKNYLAAPNVVPPSFDGHPRLQYAFTAQAGQVWFYDLGSKSLKVTVLAAEPHQYKPAERSGLRQRVSTASYVHVTPTDVFYFARAQDLQAKRYSEPEDPKALPVQTIYRWKNGDAAASTTDATVPQFFVWKAALQADGSVGPLLLAEKQGGLARANPALYTYVPEEELPAYAPTAAGLSEQSCLANVKPGAICSYRDHGLDEGTVSRSEPTCEPYSEEKASRIRRKNAEAGKSS
ncbi:hypothetical protein [Variovorax sp. PAMC26660]|uniref:hypothetical protein n=1 Tax=Variovorax sp. PAMC26660 TaxID=2762322 RepID=UPI00164D7B8F|nr:hypothetical protein [Variovorax sp. PAMC26660]QNK65901.1 hypothetical protein H7F35_22155 [Variovorax sp. PAMC26660]